MNINGNFHSPAVNGTSVTATSTGSKNPCGFYWNSPGRAEQTGSARPSPHQAAHPEHPQIPTASIRTFKARFAHPCHQPRLICNSHFFILVYQPKSLPGWPRGNQGSVDHSKNCWATRKEGLKQEFK